MSNLESSLGEGWWALDTLSLPSSLWPRFIVFPHSFVVIRDLLLEKTFQFFDVQGVLLDPSHHNLWRLPLRVERRHTALLIGPVG
jgi:hypothetical protein